MHWFARGCIALALCLTTARAGAHAPLPRALAVSPDGTGLALALPGFGLLLRTAAEPGFAYACDALLGIPPSDSPALVQYFADGSWLLGSSGGLHTFAADGCKQASPHLLLGNASVSAIAIHAETQRAYAIASGYADGIWRSEDRGASWQRSGSIESAERVNALLIDPADPARVYVSRDAEPALLVSDDAGATFQSFPQARALRLLALQAPARLWAVARAPDNKGNRGFEILLADGPSEPWQSKLRVNYFGGLTITDNGEIWVGDEGGGAYRSNDRGDSFAKVDSPRSISCLASAGDDVWACTPNLPNAPALNELDLAAAAFQPSLTLADVETRIQCPQQNAGADPCQAAWVEWQRDVLGRTGAAGAPAEAAQMPDAAVAVDAGTERPQPTASGCSLAAVPNDHSVHWPWALLLWAALRTRRTVRGCSTGRFGFSRAD